MEEVEIDDSIKEAIIDYYSGGLGKEEALRLLEWVNRSQENLDHFRSIGRVWHTTGVINGSDFDAPRTLNKLRKKLVVRDLREVPEKSIKIKTSVLYSVAASLMLLALISTGVYYMIRKPVAGQSTLSYFEAMAPKGSRSQMTLSDGTQIWLNAGTRLKYNSEYGISNRDIFLDGEAYFKVSKNEEVPFQVSTSEILITALGTAFNVKSYSEEGVIETTLEEGSLKIDPLKSESKRDVTNTVILKPNQKAVFLKSPEPGKEQPEQTEIPVARSEQMRQENSVEKLEPLPVSVIAVADTRLYTSWKDSNWVFKNEKLRTLAPKLERRYDIKIAFADTTLLSFAFSGTLKEESIEQVLEIIRLSAPIKFVVDSKDVIVQYDERMRKNFEKITP